MKKNKYNTWAKCPTCKDTVLCLTISTLTLHLLKVIHFKYRCRRGHEFTEKCKIQSK